MATLQEIERAFVAAHEAGDKEGAAILANEVRRLRSQQSSASPVPAKSSGATGDFGGEQSSIESTGGGAAIGNSSMARQVRRIRSDPSHQPQTSEYYKDVGIRTLGAAAGLPGQTAQNLTNLAAAGAGTIIGSAGETLNMMLEPINKQVNYSDLLPRADYQSPFNIDAATNRLRGIFGRAKEEVPAPSETHRFIGDSLVNIGGNLAIGGATGLIKNIPSAVGALVSGVGSTIGERVGKAMVPDPGQYPIAEGFLREGLPAIGSALGGTAQVVLPTNLVAKAWDVRSNPEKYIEKIKSNPKLLQWVKQDIENTIRKSMVDDKSMNSNDPSVMQQKQRMLENIDTAIRLQKEIPGLKLDIGQITDSPSLINEVKRLALASRPDTEAKFNKDTSTLSLLRENLVGRQSNRPIAERVIDDVLAREQQQMAGFARQADDASATQSRIASDVLRQTEMDPASIGQAIRLGRQQTQDALQPEVRSRYDAAQRLAETNAAQYDAAPIVQSVTNALENPRNNFGPENTPRIAGMIQQFMNRNAERGGIAFDENFNLQQTPASQGALDFPTLRAMREALNQDLAEARGAKDAAARSRLFALREMSRAIDETVRAGDPEVALAWSDANKFYAQEFAPRLLTGEQIKLSRSSSANAPAIPDDKVFDSFFHKGQSVPTRRFVAMANGNPGMMQTAVNGLMMKYAKDVIRDGKIDLKKHENFVNKDYKHAINALDEGTGAGVRQRFESIGNAFRSALEAQAEAVRKADEINTSAVMQIFRTKFGANDPYVATNEALSNKGAMGQLLMKMTKQEAQQFMHYSQEVLADMLSDHLPGTDTKAINPNKVKAFLDQPGMEVQRQAFEQGMARAYSPQVAKAHMQNLKDISKAAEVVQRSTFTEAEVKAMKPDALGDSFKKEYGFSRMSLFASLRTMYRIQGPMYTLGVFGSQAGYTQLMHLRDAVMKQVLADPKLAENLKVVLQSPTATPKATDAASKVFSAVKGASKFLYDILEPQNMFARQAAGVAESKPEEQQYEQTPAPKPAWLD